MIFQFAQPAFLWLLLLVPLIAYLSGSAGRKAALRFPATQLARQIARMVKAHPGKFQGWLRLIALTAGILALAQPQWGQEEIRQEYESIDIMLTVDLSSSMWAHDFVVDGRRTDRLTAVQQVMHEFVEARPHDRIGLIAFAGTAYLVSPLTVNHDWILRRLGELEIGSIEDGTAIGTAVGTAINRIRNSDESDKVVILLTDGANNRGQVTPMQAAEAAARLGIRVYTVGVGQSEPAPFPRLDPQTRRPLLDRAGNMMFGTAPSDIDTELLQAIADHTGGRFFNAENAQELQEIYDEIDLLEKQNVEVIHTALFRDWFGIPLIICLFAYFLDWLLRTTRFRRIP